MPLLHLDLETYSERDIKRGAFQYAEGCEIDILAYAFDEAPAVAVSFDDLAFPDIQRLLDSATEIVSHNAMFDRSVLEALGYHSDLNKWRCSMAQAMTHGLPGGLGALCEILNVPQDAAKDKEGRSLMMLFCKPRPESNKIRRATGATHPAERAKYLEYARLDVEAMRAVLARLPTWNYKGRELELWRLDQRINARGVAIDLDFVHAARRTSEETKKLLATNANKMTSGAVASTQQRDKTVAYILAEYGVALADLTGSTVDSMLEKTDTPEGLRELLLNRAQASLTSATKYNALLRGVSSDGRMRGLLQFSGAQRTRRWAGRTFQPQNLMRPPKWLVNDWEGAVGAIKHDAGPLVYENPIEVCAGLVRGALVPARGCKFLVSDLANIEGRVQAWFGNEQWKLDSFREYDNGTGPDMYKVGYGRSFGVSPDSVTDEQRQIGKVQELALGYQGGVGAFVTFGLAYGIDLDAMAHAAKANIPADVWEEAASYREWHLKQKMPDFGLAADTFIAIDSIKRLWRGVHAGIVDCWAELDGICKRAIQAPGTTIKGAVFVARVDGAWLRVRLPSGNVLCYPHPTITKENTIQYYGINQYTRKWGPQYTYGGKLFENACQSLARDILAHSMPLIEDAGMSIVLTVHDEIIVETPDSDAYNIDRLNALMATPPEWAKDMPLSAQGFETYRYRKG